MTVEALVDDVGLEQILRAVAGILKREGDAIEIAEFRQFLKADRSRWIRMAEAGLQNAIAAYAASKIA